jgi:hypothetical protein
MKFFLLKTANLKKGILLLFAIIGFSSLQLNAQSEATVTDALNTETFNFGTNGDLKDASIVDIIAGTGTEQTNKGTWLAVIASSVDAQGTFTFTLKSTAAPLTTNIKLAFKKRAASTVTGNVEIDNIEATTYSELTDNSTGNTLEDFYVTLTNVELTSTAKTIKVTASQLLQETGSAAALLRLYSVEVEKTANNTPCTVTDITAFTVTENGETQLDLAWTNPTCFDEMLVVAKEVSADTPTPSGDGSAYTADAAFGSGTDLGTNEFAVYKGTGSSISVTGLTKGTQYHFTVFTRRGIDWSTGVTGNGTTISIPVITLVDIVQNSTFMKGETATFTLTYKTEGSGPDITGELEQMFFQPAGDPVPDIVPVYTSRDFTYAQTNGVETTIDISFTWPTEGDFDSGTYEYRFFNKNPKGNFIWAPLVDHFIGKGLKSHKSVTFDPAGDWLGLTEVAVTVTAPVCPLPTDVTALAADAGAEYISLTWTDPTCFDEVLVVAKSSSAVTTTPSGDGTTPAYTANITFGSGTDLGMNEHIVYKGTDSSVTINGLTKGGTTYHFEVFTRQGSDWSDGVIIDATTNNTYSTLGGNDSRPWLTASNWLGGGIPTAATDVVKIEGRMLITSDVEIGDVTLNGRITLDPGVSVKTKNVTGVGLFIVNIGTTSFGSVIVDGTSTAELIYDRSTQDNPVNDLVSFPINGETFSQFIATRNNSTRISENPNIPNNYFVGPFNNTTGAFETYNTGANSTTEMVSGKGYRMGLVAGDGNNDIRFQGPFPTANVTIDITDGNHGSFGQWNLIGNPFPSYIDFDAFFTANTGQFEMGANNAIYGWNGTSYTPWNGATSGNKIAPTQGFFVKTKEGVTGTVNFTSAMRTIGTTDDFIAGRSASNNKSLAKINLSNTTKTYVTDIYFIENQTKGLDSGYDAGAFAGSADGIYTNLVENNTGVALSIQALPYEDFNDVVVPVAINSEANEVLTISLDLASLTLPTNTYVYLKDNVLNTTTLLNDADYVFTPDTKLSGAGRFFLNFSSSALSTNEYDAVNEMLIYKSQKSIIIKGKLKTEASAKVYDIQGRMVLEQKLESSNITNVINANALNVGVYLIQLENRMQKVIIKQ